MPAHARRSVTHIVVGVAVFVGNVYKDPAARCLIFGVSDSTETFLTSGGSRGSSLGSDELPFW